MNYKLISKIMAVTFIILISMGILFGLYSSVSTYINDMMPM
jgi:hypothetical protein